MVDVAKKKNAQRGVQSGYEKVKFFRLIFKLSGVMVV
jgi:hypothetical protein